LRHAFLVENIRVEETADIGGLGARKTMFHIEGRRSLTLWSAAASVKRGTIIEEPVAHVGTFAVAIGWRIDCCIVQESPRVIGEITDFLVDITVEPDNDNLKIDTPLHSVDRVVWSDWTTP